MICWGLGAYGLALTGIVETNTKEDMAAHAGMIILWGANLASQPNTGRHLAAARRRGAHVVTIDVRETEAAAQSDETILVRPGTDAALALALMHVIVAEGLWDRDFVARHTTGFEALAAHVATHTPAWAAEILGRQIEELEHFHEVDPMALYRSYQRRQLAADFRMMSNAPGPRRTAEGYLMVYLLDQQ